MQARDSRVDRAIVAGAVAIADAMGIPVVAEWIEDEHTRDLMHEMGVSLGQGFLLGMPGAVPEVVVTP
jgi:EAL domain-containing protein (putative c-di-GMP-specific phosphodiesterase class I)